MSDAKRQFKDRVYTQLAKVGKSVSSSRRIELLDLLSQAPRSVADLAEEASLSVANTSQHLQTLKEAKLVETEREGNRIIYRLSGPEVADFVVSLRRMAEARHADLEAAEREFFADIPGPELEEGDELWGRIEDGEVRVLDVRPEQEYEAGHIPGAVSMPVDQLEERLQEVGPDEEPIIVYCRGPYCTFAAEAVEELRAHGIEAVRLREGYSGWRRG